jgi:tetratricopeptide (TPR) repeat protein
MKGSLFSPLLLIGTLFFNLNSWAESASTSPMDVAQLQTRWAEIKYALPENQQEKAFVVLVQQASDATAAHPKDAPYLIWEGIIRSTYAGAKGGLGALGEVKNAKALFEQSIEIDPAAMSGSAYTSLGSLFYQVPGWPLGFGDDDKAEEMLKKGLVLNADGIDSNYFYGDFLFDQGRYDESLVVLEKALLAPPRVGRELADKGRKAEVEKRIADVKAKLGKK